MSVFLSYTGSFNKTWQPLELWLVLCCELSAIMFAVFKNRPSNVNKGVITGLYYCSLIAFVPEQPPKQGSIMLTTERAFKRKLKRGGVHLSDSSKFLEIPNMKIELTRQFMFSEE